MGSDGPRAPSRRRVLRALATSGVVAGSAGCSGDTDGGGGTDDSDPGGSGGGDGGDSGADTGGDGAGGGENEGGGGGDGADSPKAAVERYVQAGQDDDSEAMSAIVHPDGSATTSPDSGGESTGEVTVNSLSVESQSDTEATVEMSFELTVSQDGEEQTTTAVTTYEVRTDDGEWFVYSVSEPSFRDGSDTAGDAEGTQSGERESTSADGSGGDGSDEFVRESMGSVGRDDISELTLVGWESEVTDAEFNVRIAVRNDGDRQADAREYTYQITAYDESGTELESMGTAVAYPTETEMAPGDVGSVVATPDIDADPETVGSYEIRFHCDGPFAEGVYCSG